MIEFLTLFLGLVSGPQTVEVQVEGPVAAVELRLDAESVGVRHEPPWQFPVDFGLELLPRELQAVAYAADGSEIARTHQLLNLPRPPAEVHLVLERDGGGGVTGARISWESSVRPNPVRVQVLLDGEALAVSDPAHVDLRGIAGSGFHLLQVEAEFSHDVAAQAQVAFGGEYLDSIQSALTALPVIPDWKGGAPGAGEMSGWFTARGQVLRPVAVEKGLAELVIVRGDGVVEAVAALEGRINQDLDSGIGTAGVGGVEQLAVASNTSWASVSERLRRALAFDASQRLRLLMPRARRAEGRHVEMETFAISPEISAEQGGLYWALRQKVSLPGLAPEVRLADAVAVAGLQAAGANRRRAVLLVLAGADRDASRYTVAAVRRFLQALNVPLRVWWLGGDPVPRQAWGKEEVIGSYSDLRRAAKRLGQELARQRIVWFDGTHLPQEITFSPAARAEPVTGGG